MGDGKQHNNWKSRAMLTLILTDADEAGGFGGKIRET